VKIVFLVLLYGKNAICSIIHHHRGRRVPFDAIGKRWTEQWERKFVNKTLYHVTSAATFSIFGSSGNDMLRLILVPSSLGTCKEQKEERKKKKKVRRRNKY
jgi:hypothetical protein